MKTFFDTSVLLSAMVEDERCHEASAAAVAEAKSGVIHAHAMAECFALLTGGRLSVQLPPVDAARLIRVNLFERMQVVVLTARESMKVLADCQSVGVRGGGIYDCLHLGAARKAKADLILTLNVRHFIAFAPDLTVKIRQP